METVNRDNQGRHVGYRADSTAVWSGSVHLQKKSRRGRASSALASRQNTRHAKA